MFCLHPAGCFVTRPDRETGPSSASPPEAPRRADWIRFVSISSYPDQTSIFFLSLSLSDLSFFVTRTAVANDENLTKRDVSSAESLLGNAEFSEVCEVEAEKVRTVQIGTKNGDARKLPATTSRDLVFFFGPMSSTRGSACSSAVPGKSTSRFP